MTDCPYCGEPDHRDPKSKACLTAKLVATASQDESPTERDTARMILTAKGEWPLRKRTHAKPQGTFGDAMRSARDFEAEMRKAMDTMSLSADDIARASAQLRKYAEDILEPWTPSNGNGTSGIDLHTWESFTKTWSRRDVTNMRGNFTDESLVSGAKSAARAAGWDDIDNDGLVIENEDHSITVSLRVRKRRRSWVYTEGGGGSANSATVVGVDMKP